MHYKSSSYLLVFIMMHYKEKGQCVLKFTLSNLYNKCALFEYLFDCKILLLFKNSIHIVQTTLKAFEHSKYIFYIIQQYIRTTDRLNTEIDFSSEYYYTIFIEIYVV